ncbi:MAG: hypothetical protein P0Y48_11620 [Candidatus Microbacterium phytovorans]|uniref:Uncharacterized protein n=1 Tax=Candidatus Microbacterium phytovorans TaxID=3121374 RepID=A0AAJ5VZT3_9MICO|nr:hypothetical protein [Microbacterium sp.]WEK13107.1 MAG: hypothetical protein P0Y48_11620 [Microbacterium sp.]
MRRYVNRHAWRALSATTPRRLTVCGALVAYALAAWWAGPFIPEWLIALVGVLLLAILLYLGAAWLDRDTLDRREPPSGDD